MSLVKNSTIVIVGVVVSNLLAYVFHFIAGRMLGPKEYGEFGALMALFVLVGLPASSVGSAITKSTSRFLSENKPGSIAILRNRIQKDALILGGILLVFSVIFSQWIADFLKIDSNYPVIIIGITLVFTLILPINRGILQGMKKFNILSFNSIIEAFSRLALLFIFLNLGLGINGAILAYGLAYFIAFLLVFPFIKETKINVDTQKNIAIRPIYKFIVQVLMVNLILQSMINLPSLFIKHFFSSEFTGYWTAALNIARISLFISSAISLVMFPEIAGEKDHLLKKKILYKAAVMVLIASSVIAIVFFAIPHFLIQLLYGTSYLEATPIIIWMGFAMIFIGLIQLRVDYSLARL